MMPNRREMVRRPAPVVVRASQPRQRARHPAYSPGHASTDCRGNRRRARAVGTAAANAGGGTVVEPAWPDAQRVHDRLLHGRRVRSGPPGVARRRQRKCGRKRRPGPGRCEHGVRRASRRNRDGARFADDHHFRNARLHNQRAGARRLCAGSGERCGWLWRVLRVLGRARDGWRRPLDVEGTGGAVRRHAGGHPGDRVDRADEHLAVRHRVFPNEPRVPRGVGGNGCTGRGTRCAAHPGGRVARRSHVDREQWRQRRDRLEPFHESIRSGVPLERAGRGGARVAGPGRRPRGDAIGGRHQQRWRRAGSQRTDRRLHGRLATDVR